VLRVQPKEVVARNIRSERERLNLTQEELGDRTDGLGLPQISRVERAVYDLKVSTLVRIARGLDVPAGELLKGL
jgi:transcriptional regulator with XRE-family HTH domain